MTAIKCRPPPSRPMNSVTSVFLLMQLGSIDSHPNPGEALWLQCAGKRPAPRGGPGTQRFLRQLRQSSRSVVPISTPSRGLVVSPSEESDEEDEDAPEILHTTIDLADAAGDSPDDGLQGNAVADSKKLTENATRLAEMLAPDPVRVFNDALVLKKNTKRVAQVSTNSICRFDLIITNDYVSTYFDNNVVLKLYSELELFIKGLFYKSFDKVLQKLSFYSEEYKRILNSDRQRTDRPGRDRNDPAEPSRSRKSARSGWPRRALPPAQAENGARANRH